MTNTPPRPSDLLTLKQAGQLVGRSASTVRRWRIEHGLHDWRDATHPHSAPSLVSAADVRAIAAKLDAVSPGVAYTPYAEPARGEPSRFQSTRETHTPDVFTDSAHTDRLLDTLETERERLSVECDRLRTQLTQARLDASNSQARIATLESLLADGTRDAIAAERARLLAVRAPARTGIFGRLIGRVLG